MFTKQVIYAIICTFIVAATGYLAGYFAGSLKRAIKDPGVTIESKVKLEPDYYLTTDGKLVDTVWVYTIQ